MSYEVIQNLQVTGRLGCYDPKSDYEAATKHYVDQKKSNFIYSFSQLESIAFSTSYTPVAYFVWIDSLYENVKNIKFIFELVQPGSLSLDYQIIDSNSNILLSGSASVAGFYQIELTGPLPSADTRLTLNIKKSVGVGASPSIIAPYLLFEF